MSIITREPNHKRKSHRVNLPLIVEIEGELYKSKDWSVTGLGLENLSRQVAPDEKLEAKLLLPMPDATVTINVTLIVRNVKDGTVGFEFENIQAKHKRLLRHYIEMAVEGRIEDIEGMISLVLSPSVDSPLEDAINLTELEQGSLTRQFRIRSSIVVSFGILFILVISALLFYNTTYRIREVGIVVGNAVAVTAPISGTVESVFVEKGAQVNKGVPLFAVSNTRLKNELDEIAGAIDAVEKQIGEVDKLLRDANEGDSSEFMVPEAMQKAIDIANRIEDERLAAFESAKSLFNQRLITKKDLDYRENAHRQAVLVLQREKAKLERLRQNRDDNQFLIRQKLSLTRKLAELEQRNEVLQAQSFVTIVDADEEAEVLQLFVSKGERVAEGAQGVLLQVDHAPLIAVAVNEHDILKLKIGHVAEVYSPTAERSFNAKLVGFGLRAIENTMTLDKEVLSEKHIVVLELENKDVRLFPFERVDVWIKTLH